MEINTSAKVQSHFMYELKIEFYQQRAIAVRSEPGVKPQRKKKLSDGRTMLMNCTNTSKLID